MKQPVTNKVEPARLEGTPELPEIPQKNSMAIEHEMINSQAELLKAQEVEENKDEHTFSSKEIPTPNMDATDDQRKTDNSEADKSQIEELKIVRRFIEEDEIKEFRQEEDKFKKFNQEAIQKLSVIVDIKNVKLQYPKCNQIQDSNSRKVKEDFLKQTQIEKRKEQMRDPKNDVDTFIVDKFSEHGVENIYGDAKEQDSKHLDLVDTTIQTFFVNDTYFFVIYGFKKSKEKLQNGEYGQGNLCLYVYKVDPKTHVPNFKEPVFQDEEINNMPYDHCLYKNYQPILKFDNYIYYVKVNTYIKDKKASFELMKFDLSLPVQNNPEKEKQNPKSALKRGEYPELFLPSTPGRDNGTSKGGKLMYPTSVVFTTNNKQQGYEKDFLQNNSIIIYMQILPSEFETEENRDEDKDEHYSMMYSCQMACEGTSDWIPYPVFRPDQGEKYDYVVYSKSDQSRTHLWIVADPKFKDIYNDELEANQVKYKTCPPFYQYVVENKKKTITKLGVGDEIHSFDKLLQVFELHKDHNHAYVENESSDESKLKSINIIDDRQAFILTVIFANKNEIKYKRYVNQRYKPMTIYEKLSLDPYSLFCANEANGLVIPGTTNMFAKKQKEERKKAIQPKNLGDEMKLVELSTSLKVSSVIGKSTNMGEKYEGSEHSMKFDIYHINKLPIMSKGHDADLQIMNQKMFGEHRLDYFIYDLIDGKRKYKVFRLENMQSNPYIRFKIVGGPHEGLSIRFSSIKGNNEIHDHKVITNFSDEKYKKAGLAWSSEMYTHENSKNLIFQNIQWAQVSDDATYCKIIEFEVSWPENIETMTEQELNDKDFINLKDKELDKTKFHINPIGEKIVLFNDSLETANNTNPFYSMFEDGKIVGTQWIPVTDRISKSYEKQGVFYQLKNSQPEEFRYKSAFVKSNFFHYYNKREGGQVRGYTVVQSMISDLLDKNISKFEEQEVLQILNNEIRCIMNMYPTQMKDIIGINIKLDDYDFLQSSEVLDRQCIADFFLFQPNTIAKMISKFDHDKEYQNRSIIQDFIDMHGNLQRHYVDFQRFGLFRATGCISIDRIHSNSLARCFDDDKTYNDLCDQEENKKEKKNACGHFRDVLNHLNEKYNPIKRFYKTIDNGDQESVKEYFCPDNHKAELYRRDINENETLTCGKCGKVIDKDDKEIYKTDIQYFHKQGVTARERKSQQEKMKDESILKMSGQHLLNYVLKKKPNIVEHDFINNIMDILIQESVQFQVFFENQMQYGAYFENVFEKSYANLVDMKELPDSTKDRSVIRLLRSKHANVCAFDSRGDHDFIKRFMETYFQDAMKTEVAKKVQVKKINDFYADQIAEDEAKQLKEEMEKELMLKSLVSPKNSSKGFNLGMKSSINASSRYKKPDDEKKKAIQTRIVAICQKFLDDPELYHGKTNKKEQKTQNFVIDFSSKKLYTKMIQLQRGLQIETVGENYDLYQLSCLMTSINEQFGDEIELHTVLQKIIDSLFADTAIHFKRLILLYTLYIVPFFIQMLWYQNTTNKFKEDGVETNFYSDDSTPIIICNIICMAVTTIFFILELIQMKELKLQYFTKPGAHHEVLWFFIQLAYFLLRISDPQIPLPIYDHILVYWKGGNVDSSITWIIIQSWLTIFLVMMFTRQILYLIQYNHNFGTMVNLVARTMNQVYEFLVFFFFTIMLMSTILKSTGIDVVTFQNGLSGGCPTRTSVDNFEGRTFVLEENSIWQYYIYTFYNAIGQATEPCYPYWLNILNKADLLEVLLPENIEPGLYTDIQIAKFMRLSIWLLWIFMVTFLFIILCNFLIAYISQSYEDVLEKRVPDIYKQRCILNEEFYLYRRWFWRTFNANKIKSFDCFLLTFDTSNNLGEDEIDAHLGVIKKVQETLKEHKSEIREAINQNGAQMTRVQEEMKLYRDLMTNYKKQLNETGTDIITHCNSIILDNNKKIPEFIKEELKASIKSGTNNQEKTKVSAKVQERIKEAENRLKAEAKERLEEQERQQFAA